jgi:hypothetical protein
MVMMVDAPVGWNLFSSPWNFAVRTSVMVSPACGLATVRVPQTRPVPSQVVVIETIEVWPVRLVSPVVRSATDERDMARADDDCWAVPVASDDGSFWVKSG